MVGFFDGQCNIGRFLMYIKTGGIHPEFWPTYQSGTPIGFHKNSKEGRRVRSLRYNYGIDLCDFNYLLKTQNYRCGLCGVLQEELSYNLCVDHCHKTNKVRGLLCHCCNIALDFIENKKLNIERATLYLNRELGYGLTKSTVLNNRK